MANEVAAIIELIEGGVPIRMTVDDGTAVPKGTLMEVTDDRIAVATAADNDEFIGIAASEKVKSDGKTTLDLWTKGIFDLRSTGATAVGERVSIKDENEIAKVAAADILFSNVGIALETCVGAEIIAVYVGGIN